MQGQVQNMDRNSKDTQAELVSMEASEVQSNKSEYQSRLIEAL